MGENEIKIIQIAVTVFVAFITAFLTNLNERKKQTTVFFKQEGIKSQKLVLDFWCSILFSDYEKTIKRYISNNEKRIIEENCINKSKEITDVMVVKLVQKDSYMYSSKSTIKYIGNYMQEIYKSSQKKNFMRQMFLVAKIISNMKYDFTGEKISVLNLLKIKINDLDYKKVLKIYWYQIQYKFFIK